MNIKALTDKDRAELLARFSDFAFPDTQVFTVERTEFAEGHSFSGPALTKFHDLIALYIGGRIMARWQRTKEPPTIVKVEVRVAVG